MQFVQVIRKRAARYATTKTWSLTAPNGRVIHFPAADPGAVAFKEMADKHGGADYERALIEFVVPRLRPGDVFVDVGAHVGYVSARSEEHTSELQSLMRISYAVFCLKKKTNTKQQ